MLVFYSVATQTPCTFMHGASAPTLPQPGDYAARILADFLRFMSMILGRITL
ncbi:hypothetical protein FB480_101485 [Agrobacterium vitis]|nr:hypothetical protein FB480_101485 [Agrobacterium vitis]